MLVTIVLGSILFYWLKIVPLLSSSLPVAVCVSGQIGRFQPHHLLKGLVEPNPSIYFYFFYNLQLHDQLKGERTSKMQGTLQEDLSKDVIYSTDPNIFFNTTKFSWMKNYEVSDHVTKLMNTNNSKVVSVNYGYALNVSYWRKVMNGSLDRMQFYGTEDLQARILNMYQFQPKCIDQMLAFEQYQNVTFKIRNSIFHQFLISRKIFCGVLEYLIESKRIEHVQRCTKERRKRIVLPRSKW